MKTAQFSTIMSFFFGLFLFVSSIYAQNYAKWSLPDGAKARLGKGWITGEIAYSPDGSSFGSCGLYWDMDIRHQDWRRT